MTYRGEGPLLAYHQLLEEDVTIIAVAFPPTYGTTDKDGQFTSAEIPEKLQKFFAGVGIPIVRMRLPFDQIIGADAHNREMSTIIKALAIFGGSVPLAIQAVLQATDSGHVNPGENVIAVTSDTAVCVTGCDDKGFSDGELRRAGKRNNMQTPAIPNFSTGTPKAHRA